MWFHFTYNLVALTRLAPVIWEKPWLPVTRGRFHCTRKHPKSSYKGDAEPGSSCLMSCPTCGPEAVLVLCAALDGHQLWRFFQVTVSDIWKYFRKYENRSLARNDFQRMYVSYLVRQRGVMISRFSHIFRPNCSSDVLLFGARTLAYVLTTFPRTEEHTLGPKSAYQLSLPNFYRIK